jgi:cytochrome P450 family 6
MELVIALLVTAVGVICWHLRKTLRYWSDRNVLHESPTLPWGNLDFQARNISMIERMKQIYDQFYGKDLFCGIYFTISPRLLLLDCKLIKDVLIKDFNNFHDRGIYTNEKGDPLSYHLFFMEGEPLNHIIVFETLLLNLFLSQVNPGGTCETN